MKIAIGADHAGYELKRVVHSFLEEKGHFVVNCGADGPAAVDYPDFTQKVAELVSRGEAERGIMICGSGVGASVAANKIAGIRAGLCHDTFSARQGVEDDDTNMLCLGARVIGVSLALDVVGSFLAARFSNEERHARRRDKVLALERRLTGGYKPK